MFHLQSVCIILMHLAAFKSDHVIQPKIKLSPQGELVFDAAPDKMIDFLTYGRGGVFLNDIDLSKAATCAKNVSLAIREYHQKLDTSIQKYHRLQECLNNGTLHQKIRGLEDESRRRNVTSNISDALYNKRAFVPQLTNEEITLGLTYAVSYLNSKLNRITQLLAMDLCRPNPCRNSGICFNSFYGFKCSCPDGWEGHTCQNDVNECERFAGTDIGCQNGATCNNTQGSYQCVCAEGWLGEHCIEESTECAVAGKELCVHGVCVSVADEYTCLCDQGWTREINTTACTVDVDECSQSHPCSVNPYVECINVPGSFRCGSCPQGFSGNGFYCSDMNECERLNGGCSTNPLVRCINTHGSRICDVCPTGYVGDGVTCTVIENMCRANNGGCHPLATCYVNPAVSSTFVTCTCQVGYFGDGMGINGCQRSNNSCDSHPCQNGGSCSQSSNSTDGYVCHCQNFYTGVNCQVTPPCDESYCQNGGTCYNTSQSTRVCSCPDGFSGTTCEIIDRLCGITYKVQEGSVTFPMDGHPITSTETYSCSWIIETDPSQVLDISFKKLDVVWSEGCVKEYVEVRDGPHNGGQQLGKFCKITDEHNYRHMSAIYTVHNFATVRFWSENITRNSSVEFAWTSREPDFRSGCNWFVIRRENGTTGTVTSPGYPGHYPNSRDCGYGLQAKAGMYFHLVFNSLDIGHDANCSRDFIEITQRVGSEREPWMMFCDSVIPAPFDSEGSEIRVRFYSDDSDSHGGFELAYTILLNMENCGGTFTNTTGYLVSPPRNIQEQNVLICEYLIQVPPKNRIQLSVLKFDATDDTNWNVQIYQGPNRESPLTGTYDVNNAPVSYMYPTNELFIVFSSSSARGSIEWKVKYEAVCGGLFTGETGILETPDYRNIVHQTTTCVFEILAPIHRAISLHFQEIKLRPSDSGSVQCLTEEYIEIRDGDNEKSALIGRYCDSIPDTVSTRNALWIKYSTTTTFSGFQANYTSIDIGSCGGVYKNSSGIVTLNPTEDLSSGTCEWVFSAPSGLVIEFDLSRFFTPDSNGGCRQFFISIFENDTYTGTSQLLGHYCGDMLQHTVITSTNLAVAKFNGHSLESVNVDLSLHYQFFRKDCLYHIHSNTGAVESPGYPNRYSRELDCVWIITAEDDQQIMLNVSDFDIPFFPICVDYLEIRNGGTPQSPLIGRFCGTNFPRRIPSHTNQIYMHFVSAGGGPGTGFMISWNVFSTGCGGALTGTSGTIYSPNFPAPYPASVECYWRISVNPGSTIRIHSDPIFSGDDCAECDTCNFMKIYDGPHKTKELSGDIGKCRSMNITSTNNNLFLEFRSFHSANNFLVHFEIDCTMTMEGYEGVIESPNYPFKYRSGENCMWDIIVPARQRVHITFVSFELQPISIYIPTPPDDIVEIEYVDAYDFVKTNTTQEYIKYGTYYGKELPDPININANNARIKFVTDYYVELTGFRLQWSASGCGAHLKHPSGTIQSPNYPGGYPADSYCSWLIEVQPGHAIELEFEELDLEVTPLCISDYVKIFDGTTPSITNRIATVCHQSSNHTTVSSGSSMYIVFNSDGQRQGRGFKANYASQDSACGGEFIAPHGFLTSPNYPWNYTQRTRVFCRYDITVEENHIIELKFIDVSLGMSEQPKDQIMIYEEDFITQIAVVWEQNNRTIRSTSNKMVLRLDSVGKSGRGFKAEYRMICGKKIITEGSGTLSQNAEASYALSGNDTCEWTIEAQNPGDHVYLVVSHADHSHRCEDEELPMITIRDGDSAESPVIKEMCEAQAITIASDGAALHISVDTRIEFFATYSVFESRCGGELTSESGYFSSPYYPSRYPQNIICEWTIKVAQGNGVYVALRSSSFSIPTSPHCETDFLEVRSGNASGPIRAVYCGHNVPPITYADGDIFFKLKTSSLDANGVYNAKGFIAKYEMNLRNVLTGSAGVIESPLYPRTYHGENVYTYEVAVKEDRIVQITFDDFDFDIIDDAQQECSYSKLEVYDGIDETGISLKVLCGYTVPDSIKTSTNHAFIKMVNSPSQSGSKFRLKWQEIENDAFRPNDFAKNGICGSLRPIDLNEVHNYTIASPGYPSQGHRGTINCVWMLTTTPHKHVRIKLFSNNTSHGRPHGWICQRIVITAKDSASDTWKNVKQICTTDGFNDTIDVLSNQVSVIFDANAYDADSNVVADVYEECGSKYTQPSGRIIFDQTTPMHNNSCNWTVELKPSKRVKIKFSALHIFTSSSNSCAGSYLMFRDGQGENAPILGKEKYCGQTAPEELIASGNYLSIMFKGVPNFYSFELHFEEALHTCGDEIRLDQLYNSTEIMSPNYPNGPPGAIVCYWIIEAPMGERLRVDFEEPFDLLSDKRNRCEKEYVELRDGGSIMAPAMTLYTGCEKEYVELRDGGSIMAPAFGRFCGKAPKPSYSTGNLLHITYFTDVDNPENGFKARVSLAYCGGTITELEGTLTFPDENDQKLSLLNRTCIWHLKAPTGFVYTLHGSTVSSWCNRKTLTITVERNGQIKHMEGNCTMSGMFMFTESNSVFINSTAPTLSLKFKAEKSACGGNIEATEGSISTPHYPTFGIEPVVCIWTIKVPKGSRVTFEIEDADLGLSNMTNDENVLKFFNDQEHMSLIHVVTLEENLRNVKSTDNVMSIYLASLGGAALKGFKGHFTSGEPTVCQSSFDDDSGTIVSPHNASSYYCRWTRPDDIQHSTLALTVSLSISNSSRFLCGQDNKYYLRITEGYTDTLIKGYCYPGTYADIVRIPMGVTTVEAFSDGHSSVNFSISYKSHPCGGALGTLKGHISSPGYPTSQTGGAECSWLISSVSDEPLRLRFVDFDLGENCDENYMIIYNGRRPTAPSLGEFCSKIKPPNLVITSQYHHLWIDYHVQENVELNTRGFNITYEPETYGCAGIYQDDSDIIKSPNYPDDYPADVRCEWYIIAPEGYYISFELYDRFHIETSTGCTNDYLEVMGRLNNEYYLLEKLCGREPSARIINSTSNVIKIIFKSNSRINNTGFKAKWRFECGGTFWASDKIGYITSPSFPKYAGSNLTCLYKIERINGAGFDVSFSVFDLDDTCDAKIMVQKRSAIEAFGPTVEFCGGESPGLVVRGDRPDTNYVLITFLTGTSNNSKFGLWYKQRYCGGRLTSPRRIWSPRSSEYIPFYQRTPSCEWDIQAPKDKVIILRFSELNVQLGSCMSAGVVAYEGNSRSVLGCWSGNMNNQLPQVQSKTNNVVLVATGEFLRRAEYNFNVEILYADSSSVGCGGDFSIESEKIIESPDLKDMNCNWIFTAPLGYNIRIEFINLNLITNCSFPNPQIMDNCTCSFIEIIDGVKSSRVRLLDKLCNSSMQRVFTVHNRHALLRAFYIGYTRNAFKAKITPEKSICGDYWLNVTEEVKTLTSPFYPQSVASYVRCTWVIAAAGENERILFRFANLTTDEEASDIYNFCESTDKLIIRDHMPGTSLREYEVCGRNKEPFNLYSGSHQASITFTAVSGFKGFRMDYKLTGCSRNYTASQGHVYLEITEPSCHISIKRPPNNTITLYIQNGYIPTSDENCEDGGIEIFEGDSTGKSLMRGCNYIIPTAVFSEANEIWMQTWKEQGRINFVYTSTDQGPGCGGFIYNTEGFVTSPFFPMPYQQNITCTWVIRAPNNNRLHLTFAEFDIEGPCETNFVTVTTGTEVLGRHKFCGTDYPASLSSDDRATVFYQSSGNNTGTGWRIEFHSLEGSYSQQLSV